MSSFNRLSAVIGVFAVISSAGASGQVNFPEVEPNGPKAEATAASCLLSGDTLSGLSTGTSITAGNVADASADTFQVKTCVLPAGIYKHQLAITTTGTAGHSGTIRGLDQTGALCVGGTITAVSDTALQTSSTATTPPRKNLWYGFGREEVLYYRITGTATTTVGYTSTLSTTPVAAAAIGPFAAGPITITTCGQGHTTDTEVYVFDANLVIVPTFLNDDQCPAACAGHTFGSTLTRTYTPGRYYLALSTFSTSANQPAPIDDRIPTDQDAWDFPDGISRSSTTVAAILNFAVTDGAGTTPVLATTPGAYEIAWFKFDVTSSTAGTPFCDPGVAGVMACACGNPAGTGRGCANTGSGGGNLFSAGSASLALDAADPGSLTLTGTSMLSGSTCIFLQGGTLESGGVGATFGAGIRCAGPPLIRLYTKAIVGGAKTAPEAGDRSISNRCLDVGQPILATETRYYQIYYRDPLLPNPGGSCPVVATFNITRGQMMTWSP